MSQITFTPAHDKAIKGFAGRALRRAVAAGAKTLQFEDVYQELVIAWCQARDNWKAEYNVPFLAYLNLGMQTFINRFIQKQITDGQVDSLDAGAIVDGCEVKANDRYKMLADRTAPDAEDQAERHRELERLLAKLTPRARLFLELRMNPPKFLIDAVEAERAHAGFAKQIGKAFTRSAASKSTVFDFMEADLVERRAINAELHEFAERRVPGYRE